MPCTISGLFTLVCVIYEGVLSWYSMYIDIACVIQGVVILMNMTEKLHWRLDWICIVVQLGVWFLLQYLYFE